MNVLGIIFANDANLDELTSKLREKDILDIRVVQYAILAENCDIGENAIVGESPEQCQDLTKWGVAVVASGVRVGAGARVQAKAMVEKDVEEQEEVGAHA